MQKVVAVKSILPIQALFATPVIQLATRPYVCVCLVFLYYFSEIGSCTSGATASLTFIAMLWLQSESWRLFMLFYFIFCICIKVGTRGGALTSG